MRGDVVRLREATTTTFFLEISEPAIAPCPWFRPVQEFGTKSSKEAGLTLGFQKDARTDKKQTRYSCVFEKCQVRSHIFVSRLRVIVSLLSCGM
jgi:hypothetical protein